MKELITGILFGVTAILTFTGCQNKKEIFHPTGSGKLVNSSECKSLRSLSHLSDIADTLSCVDYIYDPSNQTVFMKHINAGFNCCPVSLSCEISFSNDTITIREMEQDHQCDCACLYDLDFLMVGIFRKKYLVRFIEPYIGTQDQLIFEMDLTSGNGGEYCLVRKAYPWGG